VTPTDGESAGLPAAKHPVPDNSDCSREASSTWSRLIIKSPKRICCCARAAAACASSLLLQIPAWWIVSCGIGRASARKPRILLNQGRLLMLLKACCNNSGELTDVQMSGWRPAACWGKVCIHPDGIARRASGKQDWQGFEGNSAMIAAAFPRQIPANPVFRSDLSVNSLISLANLSALRLAYRNAYDDKRREADRRVFYALAPRSSKASILNVPTSKTGQRPRFSLARASAALPLLDDVPASPASRRLASAHATPGTRPLLILGQAPGWQRAKITRTCATPDCSNRCIEWSRRRPAPGTCRSFPG